MCTHYLHCYNTSTYTTYEESINFLFFYKYIAQKYFLDSCTQKMQYIYIETRCINASVVMHKNVIAIYWGISCSYM